jgi:CheY-like chemotaxis protein
MNVLIVDDERLSLTALQHCVHDLGHTTILAENGEEAIAKLNENKIDLILSDIMMPGISGLSLVSVLRNVYFLETPIILISTLDTSNIINSSHYLGANDFISKPFNIADIAYKINKYLSVEKRTEE